MKIKIEDLQPLDQLDFIAEDGIKSIETVKTTEKVRFPSGAIKVTFESGNWTMEPKGTVVEILNERQPA